VQRRSHHGRRWLQVEMEAEGVVEPLHELERQRT